MIRRRIFDCFMVFNELDILEIRLREMGPFVDRFVIVESEETFQGGPKPLYYRDNAARFEAWADKIIHVVLPAAPAKPTARHDANWVRDHYQKNQIIRGLGTADDHDLVIISDVDEIIRGQTLADTVARFQPGQAVVFSSRMYKYQLNRLMPDVSWQGARMIERRYITLPHKIRELKSRMKTGLGRLGLGGARVRLRNWRVCKLWNPIVEVFDSGWHFTSIGTYENWRYKMESFAHAEAKDSEEYSRREAYDRLVDALPVQPLEGLPHCVASERRFDHLLAL